MAASAVPWLGERVREARLRRGMTIRGLAGTVSVTASMISQIETGRSQPSVSTLYALATALDVPIEELFHSGPLNSGPRPADGATARIDGCATADGVTEEGSAPRAAGQAAEVRSGRIGPRVRPGERRVLHLDTGVSWALLGRLAQHEADFLLTTYPAGATSSSSGALMRHPGSEFGFLLQGELVVTLGFETILLRPGDAISFESTTPHAYRNEGDEPARGIWFITGHGR
jgi:transcriptional regulator with XRE-family HTH domain/quercetin dioxygenase-like cupin family protein